MNIMRSVFVFPFLLLLLSGFREAPAEGLPGVAATLRFFHAHPERVLTQRSAQLRSEMPSQENFEKFLEGVPVERKLAEMEKRNLKAAEVERMPWSGSYWATRNGRLAWRYADPKFPKGDFKTNFDYFKNNPRESLPDDLLSPAEKYDLLVGDPDFGLTKISWDRGVDAMKGKPDVPKWYGLCHGWAPAAYLEPEPVREVKVTARDGRTLTFWPSDIKALASSVFGDIDPKTVFVGKKCTKDKPERDEMGRVIDPDCFNTNPATWHLSVVNRVGLLRKPLILDATYDIEVWNQPIISYEYSYFNPQTLKTSADLPSAIVARDQFAIDKFKKYRSGRAKFMVGVAMDIRYVVETVPTQDLGHVKPPVVTVRYLYDLELDENQEVIGGEWYTNRHPDFIWIVDPQYKPRSSGEEKLKITEKWGGDGPVPDSYVKAARISSAQSEPLAEVVRTLIDRSREP